MSQNSFYFIGQAPLSKSLLNRSLIIKSWYPDFLIHGSSLCEDVLVMDRAIKNLGQKKEFNCGFSGTAFRFLALRLSRQKGEFILKADTALLKRPLEEVSSLLAQLSVSVQKTKQAYMISSEAWKLQGDCVYVPSQITSQWASALLLNSWNLDQDLYFVFSSSAVSYSYFKMTLDFVRKLGLTVHQEGSDFFIPKGQNLKIKEYHPEQDKSCLFALACFSALKGQSIFLNWEKESLQADHIFPDILKSMGVTVELRRDQNSKLFDSSHKPIFQAFSKNDSENKQIDKNQSPLTYHSRQSRDFQVNPIKSQSQLIISKCSDLKPLDINLKDQPDLFPMLAILCAKAEGLSVLKGVSHLAFKESNRLEKLKEVLEKCGIAVKIQKDDFLIYGQKNWSHKIIPFDFSAEEDHRLVMVAELIASLGIPIHLKGKSAV
ncbi:MAG: hypothetical protein OXC37_04390, partial [Bdellovibrionaceae bacterium]|nr:hypothetical protein [Pseudobdellovibrionaceae bacterium]